MRVPAESVFAVEGCDDEAGVEEGGTEVPEGGGEFTRLFRWAFSVGSWV